MDKAVFFSLALVGLIGAGHSATTCPAGYERNEKSCYKFNTDVLYPGQAKTFCEQDNAHLVSVQTSSEYEYLRGEITSRSDQVSNYHNCWWSSGKLEGGNWIWEDTGLNIDFNEAPWYPDQPSNTGGNEVLIDICDIGVNYGLNDQQEDRTNAVVCEIELECLPGYEMFGDSCYKYNADVLYPDVARTFCDQDNAHLVSVQTECEYEYLRGQITSRSDQVSNPHNCWWSSGKLVDGNWIWEDTGLAINFNEAPWYPDQPSNSGGNETLIDICDIGVNYGLNDQQWHRTNAVVCEYTL